MDGIGAIGARIAAIQSTLAAVSPRTPSVASASSGAVVTGGGPASGAGTFEAVLARETAGAVAVSDAPPQLPGLTTEQVRNAAAIVSTGRSMGLSLRDQAIGVMTAMGESSLRVLDHGDRAGPDSRGLFQQRDNGAWGTLAERMDPTASARSFFRALTSVTGRAGMPPTLVAHTVQRNADPQHYARWWDDAVGVVSRLTGATAAQVTGG